MSQRKTESGRAGLGDRLGNRIKAYSKSVGHCLFAPSLIISVVASLSIVAVLAFLAEDVKST
ncbi:MAG: hypothetical protein N3H31_05840 [Candidatus Nezhaarchaeota archaeon]|nr:hypothetical protein [Candidatus Nezhaarchaeota archaeon]